MAYDIHSTDISYLSDIKSFLIRRILLKYSRFDSYYTYKDTFYIGLHGNSRHGIKGIRLYEKTENGETFFRLEVQFNRRYLKKINLQYRDLPVSPLSFNALSFIELRDTFSDKGVQNIARNILRTLDITPASENFNQKHNEMIQDVRKYVIGGTKGPKRRTSSQIGQAKLLVKKYGLSIDIMHYFHLLDFEKQLIACHAAVGCAEDNVDKRMIFLEIIKK